MKRYIFQNKEFKTLQEIKDFVSESVHNYKYNNQPIYKNGEILHFVKIGKRNGVYFE